MLAEPSENIDRTWLRQALPMHQRLSAIVAAIVENSLRSESIDHLSVTHRTKTESGALEKISRKDYDEPGRQLTDLSGIRIITYLEEHITQVSDLISRLFEIDADNSQDRSKMLGYDRVGYRSTHFVCTLGAKRNALEEYKGLGDLRFEIQVRTVLQHAWAEMAHDWSFKFGIELPIKIQRKLNLMSGQLESLDNSFGEIAKEIQEYKTQMEKTTILQIEDAELNSISLSKFIEELAPQLDIEIKGTVIRAVHNELHKFGISKIGQLRRLASPQFIEAHKQAYKAVSTSIGVVRRLMMFEDLDRYVSAKPSFVGIASPTYEFLRKKYSAEVIDTTFKKASIHLPKR
jgi:putative GTP pyrophosphokinase